MLLKKFILIADQIDNISDSVHSVLQTMTKAAFFTVGRSRTIGYGKIRPKPIVHFVSKISNLYLICRFILLKEFKKKMLIRNCNEVTSVQVIFVVDTVLSYYCIYYEYYLNRRYEICMFFPEKITSLMLLWSLETRKKDVFLGNFQWPISKPKTSAAKAEGRLITSFGIGRLGLALVIVCSSDRFCFVVLKKMELIFLKIVNKNVRKESVLKFIIRGWI